MPLLEVVRLLDIPNNSFRAVVGVVAKFVALEALHFADVPLGVVVVTILPWVASTALATAISIVVPRA